MNESGTPNRAATFSYRFGSAEFDAARFELRVGGLAIDVQRKPLEVLALLLARVGEVVTKEELHQAVWGGRPTVDNVLANAVAKLRGALGADNAERIATVARVGYRFDGRAERTVVGRPVESQLELKLGDAVPNRPHFRLEALIGQSVHSEVWLARHDKTREARVYKFALGGERLASLKREVTLFRYLQDNLGAREDIVRVLDWHFEMSPFFIECEYAGPSLAVRGSAGWLATQTPAQRLALFLQIGDAVAAAHGVGVLHKDLKPANVLVADGADGQLIVKLTDFGSARLLDPERLAGLGITQFGFTLTQSVGSGDSSGTPLYLAPELLSGQQPTVQSDLYSLGVMLYQLLVGDLRRQLVPGWERDVEDELLREDLARSTDGDPRQRLTSVGELLDRLRRLPERRAARVQELETARRGVEAQRVLERTRARRPWLVAVGLSLAVGLAASLWMYRDASEARARAEAINRFLNWEVLANTGALKTDRDPDPSMRRVLINASASVGESFANDPGSEGWIRLAIGEGLGGLGDYPAAEAEERRSVELLTRAYGPSHIRTLDAVYTLIGLMMEQSKFTEVGPLLDDADKRLAKVSSQSIPVVMRGRAMRGTWYASRKQCVQALENLEAAAEAQQKIPNAMAYDAFSIRSWIGGTLLCLGRYGEAELLYADLLGARYSEEDVGAAQLNWARVGYAELQSLQGRTDEAERSLATALPALSQSQGDSDPLTQGQALIKAGSIYMRLQKFDVARTSIAQGQELLQTVHQGQVDILDGLRTLGAIEVMSGKPQEGLVYLDRARAGFVTAFGEANADVQGTDYWRARALADLGRAAEAATLAAQLQSEMLRASLGGEGWVRRLEALTTPDTQI